ncbi:fas-binding factor 1 isoform X2 [Tenrec ecaudatus]|uniref:fas-binding factor 1 isoform X2 n=1 Tax=Tenrec ecaudatus TaxID=94439 RepID=UPI003F59B8FE
MATKTKKGLKGSIDDVLGDLLGDDTTLPEKPIKLTPRASSTPGGSQPLPSRTRTKSLLEDDFFGTMAGLVGADAEVSDVSDADPQAVLQGLKDMDDMDADLLGLKKPSPASSKTAVKASGKEEPPAMPRPAPGEKGDAAPLKKPPPAPGSGGGSSGFGAQHRKFPFEDTEDPLAGLLSDEEEDVAKQLPRPEHKAAPPRSPSPVKDRGPSVPLTPGDTPVRKKDELMFDDGDDLMAALGFGDNPKVERGQAGDQEVPRPARSKLDELLGRGTAARLLMRPGTGQHREFTLDRKYQRPQDKDDAWGDEDFTFGAYQPTVGSSEGSQARRPSIRFLAESGPDPKGSLGSRQNTPATPSPVQPKKGGAAWLGLKDDEDLDLLPSSPTREARRGGSELSVPPPASQHPALGPNSAPARLPSSRARPPEGVGSPPKASQAPKPGASEEKDEGDWLSHALSRKKFQGPVREEQAGAAQAQTSGDTADHPPPGSRPAAHAPGAEQAAPGGTSGTPGQDAVPAARPEELRSPVTRVQAALATPAANLKSRPAAGAPSAPEPTLQFPRSQEVPVQSLLPEPLPPSTKYEKQLLAAQAQLQGGTAELQAALLHSQARLAELEAQVRKLELERSQHELLLESMQQRHQADLELIEGAHRSRVQVLETSYQQREDRLRRENEELSAQYLAHCREAELARTELTAQHQRRLAAAAQEKDQEMERLRDLQRASIVEMRKDHEEQLQRLKLLKDREIDAVTSATSHTRSLNGVIEQMEKFSSSLHELSSRVEASHLTTSQERELGARQRDAQLRVLQDRLSQQQQDMEAERSRLQEVIAKMEARLGEQSRLLEQERWRVSAEQCKAESAQRALEEQRKAVVRQAAMEREELERAKSALLEEQKAVMHRCAEERGRLSSEWAELSAQQRLSKERAERDAERALQVDTQREGTLVSLAKVGPDAFLPAPCPGPWCVCGRQEDQLQEQNHPLLARPGPAPRALETSGKNSEVGRPATVSWPVRGFPRLAGPPVTVTLPPGVQHRGGARVAGAAGRAVGGGRSRRHAAGLSPPGTGRAQGPGQRAQGQGGAAGGRARGAGAGAAGAAVGEGAGQRGRTARPAPLRGGGAHEPGGLGEVRGRGAGAVRGPAGAVGAAGAPPAGAAAAGAAAAAGTAHAPGKARPTLERPLLSCAAPALTAPSLPRPGQEQLSLAQQRLQLDRVRQDLPSALGGLLPRLQAPVAPSMSAAGPAATTSPWCSQLPLATGLVPSHFHAKLVLLKHTAEQDRDFLENEEFFLETLKRAPYNMTSHSA